MSENKNKYEEVPLFNYKYLDKLSYLAQVDKGKYISGLNKFDYDKEGLVSKGSTMIFLDNEKLNSEFKFEPEPGKGSWQAKEDAQNAKVLFESILYKDKDGSYRKLTPFEASNMRLWTYLSHTYFWNYMQKRWTNINPEKTDVLGRYIISGNKNKLASSKLTRHGVSRLWWYAYLTWDIKNKTDPYHLLSVVGKNTDIALQLFDRKISHNRTFVNVLLTYLRDNPDKCNPVSWNYIFKSLLAQSGTRNIAFLPKGEIIKIVKDIGDSAPNK